jgi:hypothetical protein
VVVRSQMTFVPGTLVPAGGVLSLWIDDRSSDGSLQEAVAGLDLPAGTAATLPTIRSVDGDIQTCVVPAQEVAILPAIRTLATLPPGPDWPGWSRPSPSVLAWSAAAKLALELVAAGRLIPMLRPGADPTEAIASWRVATADDPRLDDLAAAFPIAAHALRRDNGSLWTARELLAAFLDAVADACAREGRRPELDPRRRGPRRPLGEMWADALTGSDPTVAHLRIPADELGADMADWAAPLLGTQRTAHVRLNLRLLPPPVGDDGAADLPPGSRRPRSPGGSPSRSRARPTRMCGWTQPRSGSAAAGPSSSTAGWSTMPRWSSAARLFAPIDRSLSEVRPTGSTCPAARSRRCSPRGRTRSPPAASASRSRRSCARPASSGCGCGSASAVDPGRPRVEGADAARLSSITDLRYEVALGDDTLSDEEFAEIVALKQPLVRWRGTLGARRPRRGRPARRARGGDRRRSSSPRRSPPPCRGSTRSTTSAGSRPSPTGDLGGCSSAAHRRRAG